MVERGHRSALPLSDRTLGALAGRVQVPTYDRHALSPAVVHISVGSFSRSHQAMYFDELAERRITDAWGITGVGLGRPEMQRALDPQDGLYTVLERGAGGDRARVVGVLRRYLYAPWGADVVHALADPRTRLVTLTVTGGGYLADPSTGEFDPGLPEVAADLAWPGAPRTAIGHLVEGLHRRRQAGLDGFTVLSCDNVPDNGRLARRAVVGFAELRDPSLARWIEEHAAFPSSMVDRITPRTTPADRELLEQRFGVRDRWPVVTEPFTQWVVEDRFAAGRPPLDEVGVRFVGDVRPYSLVKTRMLNASHCAVGALGTLAGLRRTDEALRDHVLAPYVDRLMAADVAPLLPPVPGMDLDDYRRSVIERLENPSIRDDLRRLCRSGSSKMPVHVLSSIATAREQGREHPLLTLAVAGWMRLLQGTDDAGREVTIDDPMADVLRPLAREGGTDPRPLLAVRPVFGALGADERFAAELHRALVALDRRGALGAVADALGGPHTAAAA